MKILIFTYVALSLHAVIQLLFFIVKVYEEYVE